MSDNAPTVCRKPLVYISADRFNTQSYPSYKLGCLPPDPTLPSIKYKNIRAKVSDNVLAATPVEPIAIPPSADYLKPFDAWDSRGNDKFGVCVASAWAHLRRIVSSKLGRREVYPDLNQVFQFYKTQNPEFDPSLYEEGGKTPYDKGMQIQQGLNYLHQHGGPDGVKAIAFASVDVKNIKSIHAALATFGSLWLHVHVLDNNFQENHNRKPWTVSTAEYLGGGHAVIAGAYATEIRFVTWGGVSTFSTEYWNSGLVQVKEKIDGKEQVVQIQPVAQAWIVIWPEHIGSRRFMIGVDIQQLANEYHDVTGRNFNFPVAPFSTLYFIQTQGSQSGAVEIHNAVADDSYATSKLHAVTQVQAGQVSNGIWAAESEDIYFIKTSQTSTGRIEVSRLPSDNSYRNFEPMGQSAFATSDASNGVFTIENEDLYFTKTKNTAKSFVEVFFADHQKKFATIESSSTSDFPTTNATDGNFFTIRGGNLYLIKTRNTASGKVEVQRADGSKGYKNIRQYVSNISTSESQNGTWDIGPKGDLYLVKTQNLQNKYVEVHTASVDSDYKALSHYASVFKAEDGPKGFWCV